MFKYKYIQFIFLIIISFVSPNIGKAPNHKLGKNASSLKRDGVNPMNLQVNETSNSEKYELAENGEAKKIDNPNSLGIRQRKKISKNVVNSKRKKSLAKKSADSVQKLSTNVFSISKQVIKSSIDLLAYKHVRIQDITGKWKISQEVTLKPNIIMNCPATIQFLANGDVVTRYQGKEYRTQYVFKEKKWPRACSIKFDAYAFQGPSDEEPILMSYKAYFKRSILNPKIILMRGKIYRKKKRAMWTKQEKCGTLKGTLRRYR